MSFHDHHVSIGTVPRPVDFMCRYAMEIASPAMKAALFDEKPNLAFEHVINLLRLVRMWRGVIARRSNGVHEAALVAITSSDNHRSFAFHSRANHLAFGHIRVFYVQRHGTRSL